MKTHKSMKKGGIKTKPFLFAALMPTQRLSLRGSARVPAVIPSNSIDFSNYQHSCDLRSFDRELGKGKQNIILTDGAGALKRYLLKGDDAEQSRLSAGITLDLMQSDLYPKPINICYTPDDMYVTSPLLTIPGKDIVTIHGQGDDRYISVSEGFEEAWKDFYFKIKNYEHLRKTRAWDVAIFKTYTKEEEEAEDFIPQINFLARSVNLKKQKYNKILLNTGNFMASTDKTIYIVDGDFLSVEAPPDTIKLWEKMVTDLNKQDDLQVPPLSMKVMGGRKTRRLKKKNQHNGRIYHR